MHLGTLGRGAVVVARRRFLAGGRLISGGDGVQGCILVHSIRWGRGVRGTEGAPRKAPCVIGEEGSAGE